MQIRILSNLTLLATLILLIPQLLNSQSEYSKCYVMQSNSRDTTKQHISHIQEFDTKGNIVYEKYQNYKLDHSTGKTNHECVYKYIDDKLVEKIMIKKPRIGNGSDSLKHSYQYHKNELTEESKFNYTNRTKKAYKGCTPKFPDDFREKTWRSIGGFLFHYNEKSQLVEKEESDHYFSRDRYLYEYDEKGRIIKTTFYYGRKRIAWIETTTYEVNKKTMVRIWENRGVETPTSNPIHFTFEYLLDNNGNVTKETCRYNKLDKKGILHSYKTYEYDEAGKLKLFKSFGKDHKIQIMHLYVYDYD